MKKNLFPPYIIILLFLLSSALILTLRTTTKSLNLISYTTQKTLNPKPQILLNQTLIKQATFDISEPKLKQEIQSLLQSNYLPSRINRHRSFLSSSNYRHSIDTHLHSTYTKPVNPRSPEFYRLWLSFRNVLNAWWRIRIRTSTSSSCYNVRLDEDFITNVKFVIDKKKGNNKYKKCAVVGNSGILLRNEYGDLIDSHDAVIRLNNARIASFERNVGRKTTVSFVNSNILHLCARRERCSCHPYGENVPIVMYVCQPVHLLDFVACNATHNAPLIVTDPRFDVLCARIVKYYSLKRFVESTGKGLEEWGKAHDGENFHYSSGMQAVMLALGVCEEVGVFGFGKSELARHHYHTNQKAELSLHDYEAEYDFYRDLVERPEAIPFVSDKFKFPRVVMYH